jgi:outer membrane protein assembly factor BamA
MWRLSFIALFCLYSIKSSPQSPNPQIPKSSNQFSLFIKFVDKDTSFKPQTLGLQTSFATKVACTDYIFNLPSTLAAKGYPTASVDTVYMDSTSAHIDLFLGQQYSWADIRIDSIEKRALDAVGWNKKFLQNKRFDFDRLEALKQSLITYYGRNGYPFAKVSLDSIRIQNPSDSTSNPQISNLKSQITATLKVDKGVLYHIDSIHIYGKAKIKNSFIQRYLGIPNGSVYNSEKLQAISKKLLDLQYIQEQQRWDITMLGTGSILNLYLQPKRSSQVDVLIGILPGSSATSKTQITGNVNLNLKNSLGYGETILVNWQQLQKQSPKLNLGYQHPYIFNFPVGLDFSFDLYKKDSAYIQVNSRLGVQYILSSVQTANVFYQLQRTFLLSGGYDTNAIRVTKRLPQDIDVSANNIGIEYIYSNTNYRYNPRKGNELSAYGTAGLKNIIRNNDIISIKDPSNPSFNFASLYDSLKSRTYQFNIKLYAAHYIPSGKRSAWKLALNTAIFQSPFIFRNELYRIGGYKLLRGFDEESIFANKYLVYTTEFRYLTGLNSYLYLFNDIGFTQTHFQSTSFNNNFIGTGVGLSFETKVGILNVSYAIGKRDDVPFNFKQASKIHFGYINYF